MSIDPKKIKIIYGREDSIDDDDIEQDKKELEMALNAKERLDEIILKRKKEELELERKRRELEGYCPQREDSYNKIKCPHCGNLCKEGARICIECGSPLNELNKTYTRDAEGKCTSCGSSVAPNAKFCGECGAKMLSYNAKSPSEKNNYPEKNNYLSIGDLLKEEAGKTSMIAEIYEKAINHQIGDIYNSLNKIRSTFGLEKKEVGGDDIKNLENLINGLEEVYIKMNFYICPNCKKYVKQNSSKCKKCGEEIKLSREPEIIVDGVAYPYKLRTKGIPRDSYTKDMELALFIKGRIDNLKSELKSYKEEWNSRRQEKRLELDEELSKFNNISSEGYDKSEIDMIKSKFFKDKYYISEVNELKEEAYGLFDKIYAFIGVNYLNKLEHNDELKIRTLFLEGSI